MVFGVTIDPELQAPVLETGALGAPVYQIAVSSNRAALSVVRCPKTGAGRRADDRRPYGRADPEPPASPLLVADSASVTDDGRTVVVAFVSGEIGVRSGDEWVEPSSLSLGKSGHNDFQRG